jgi:predicted transcriptional regulator
MAKVMTMIRMDEKVKNQLKRLAESENRSLSNFILNATLAYVKDNYDKEISLKESKK